MTDTVTLKIDAKELCKFDKALQAAAVNNELVAKLHTVANRLRDDLVCDNETIDLSCIKSDTSTLFSCTSKTKKLHTLAFCQNNKKQETETAAT